MKIKFFLKYIFILREVVKLRNAIAHNSWVLSELGKKDAPYPADYKITDYLIECGIEQETNAIETSYVICNPSSWKLMEKLEFIRRTENPNLNHYTFSGDIKGYSYGITKEEYKNQ